MVVTQPHPMVQGSSLYQTEKFVVVAPGSASVALDGRGRLNVSQ